MLLTFPFRYLTRYLTEDSFDNKYIDDNIRRLWRFQGKDKLTPLNFWELRGGKYQVSSARHLSKAEVKRYEERIRTTQLTD